MTDKLYNGFREGRAPGDHKPNNQVRGMTQETMTKEIKELVLNEYKNGNIVVAGIEGLQTMPIKEFIKQDAEFMLYDLNRSEAVVLTFINDPKWVNDYAVCKVIRELKQQLSAERERAGKLVDSLQKLAWHLDRLKQYDIVELIKQTLNDYDTATKES